VIDIEKKTKKTFDQFFFINSKIELLYIFSCKRGQVWGHLPRGCRNYLIYRDCFKHLQHYILHSQIWTKSDKLFLCSM